MLLAGVFTAVLSAVYVYKIAPIMVFEDISYYSTSVSADGAMILLALVPTLWLPTNLTKPSQFCNWILYLTVVVPACVQAPHVLTDRFPVWPMVLAVTISFCFLLQISNFKPLKLPRFSVSPTLFWGIAIVISVATYASLIAFYGMPKAGISLSTAENLRSAFKEQTKEVPMIVRYLFRWEADVVLPCFCAFGVVKRKILPIAIACAGEVGLFLLTTFREFALTPLLLMGVAAWLYSSKKHNGVNLIAAFASFAVALGTWLVMNPVALLPLLFFDRFILTGGQHTAFYYDYFSHHQPALFGASFGRFFIQPPYSVDVGQIIGSVYYLAVGDTGTNATANFWSDAFGNALWPGFIIASIVAMLLFWVMDSAYTRTDKRIAVLMGVMISLSINGQGLHTSMLTGGVVPMIFVGLIGSRTLRPTEERTARKRKEELPSQIVPQNA